MDSVNGGKARKIRALFWGSPIAKTRKTMGKSASTGVALPAHTSEQTTVFTELENKRVPGAGA
jgi:hypothetical protein